MRRLPLQRSIVYGPVASRRFGASIGINLLPATRRLCSFDCVYCQYPNVTGPGPCPDFSEIYVQATADLESLRNSGVKPDWIMLSGNGEPTLHPDFPDLVDAFRTLRDLPFPGVPLGVLSNSSTCGAERIRRALCKLEGRFMKLDAGDPATFEALNRPASPSLWEHVLRGLEGLPDYTMQSLFVTGRVDNTRDRVVEDWIAAVRRVRPKHVQIYTVDREPQESGVEAVDERALDRIAARLVASTGVPASVFAGSGA